MANNSVGTILRNKFQSLSDKLINLVNSGNKLFTVHQEIEKLVEINKNILYVLNSEINKSYYSRICGMLEPKRPVNIPLKRFGRLFDGGYIMADCFPEGCVAYSFGINDDVSWDKDVANRGIQVFMYDHTIDVLPEQHKNFVFSRKGVCGKSSSSEFQTLEEFLHDNNHAKCDNIILKMDIEGAEYDVINLCNTGVLEKFSQIVIEWHNILEPTNAQLLPALEKINALFQCVHLHGQDVPGVRIGNKILPNLLEATYLRKSDHQFTEMNCHLPLDEDYPTRKGGAELYLGDYSN